MIDTVIERAPSISNVSEMNLSLDGLQKARAALLDMEQAGMYDAVFHGLIWLVQLSEAEIRRLDEERKGFQTLRLTLLGDFGKYMTSLA